MPPLFDRRQQRALLWLMVFAACWRWLLAARTPVPAQDGCTYLWMAQQLACGDVAAALSEPFSPLWPLLLSLPIALGAAPIVAANVLGCVVGALALLPIAAIAERLRGGAGVPAAALAAVSSLLARTAVEGYTEPLFVLVMACGLAAGMAGRWRWLAMCSALAFLVRPEGLVLPLPFLLTRWRRAWPALLAAGGAVLIFGLWRWSCGLGLDPVPKLLFHASRDELGAERGDLLGNLAAMPPAFLEAFGGAALLCPLALLRPRPRGAAPVWTLLLLGVAVIASFVVRRRFFVAWAFAALPLAGAGILWMSRLGPRGRELLLAAVVGVEMWTAWHGTIDQDRVAERLVGQHLQQRLAPGAQISTDLTRVRYFAGLRPLPARRVGAREVVDAARRDPAVQFVVISTGNRRDDMSGVQDALADSFAVYGYPPDVGDAAAARGIVTLVRR